GVWVLRIPDSGFRIPPSRKRLWTDAWRLLTQFPRSAIRNPQLLLLATGAFVWWLGALVITGDPLFIKHNWPANWPITGTVYGAAGLYAFPIRLPEIVGLFLLAPFFYALFPLLQHHRLSPLTPSFLLFLTLHAILRAYGLLGSAGYPRYLVGISRAIALITLSGWDEMAKRFAHSSRFLRTGSAGLIIAISAF